MTTVGPVTRWITRRRIAAWQKRLCWIERKQAEHAGEPIVQYVLSQQKQEARVTVAALNEALSMATTIRAKQKKGAK